MSLRVLIADDARFMRQLIRDIIEPDRMVPLTLEGLTRGMRVLG